MLPAIISGASQTSSAFAILSLSLKPLSAAAAKSSSASSGTTLAIGIVWASTGAATSAVPKKPAMPKMT